MNLLRTRATSLKRLRKGRHVKDETPSFDPADYLKTPASLAIFLKAAAAENDPAYLALARDAARRAKRRWRIDAERPSNP